MRILTLDATSELRAWVVERLTTVWGREVARRGELVDPSGLPGFVALEADGPVGYVLIDTVGGECEVVVIEALRRRSRIGSRLVDAVCDSARRAGVNAVWLVTTNDNRAAIGFYESRGFELDGVRVGAVDDARRMLKPTIPKIGESGLPMRDEWEFRLRLSPR